MPVPRPLRARARARARREGEPATIHLRIISPRDRSPEVVSLLANDPAVAHLIVVPDAGRRPAGDVVLCDVVREGASTVLDGLRALGVDHTGAISMETVEVTLSTAAEEAARAVPGLGVDAVVWDEIEQRTGEETTLSGAYLIFLTVAMIIAGIGVLLDQPILIVGAMVVGPEFGPLAALCVGIVRRRLSMVARSVLALAVGFPIAMLVTVFTTWAMTAMGLVSKEMLLAERPLTGFIWRPDALSWIVAFLAGVAGMLALTSAIQFLVNVAALVTAGIVTLLIQRLMWRRGARRTPTEMVVKRIAAADQ
ncbi:DUF389 domain-containing protein [Planosporangium flavigriseum]|uniref:DUF389 domain-containing protein n=1 Tax=Planosporangium flavigriseum TaxID=373681 RepID=UPI001EF2F103|nr:DUF389 domain-containing protein [Planosporangium flavigriseum]